MASLAVSIAMVMLMFTAQDVAPGEDLCLYYQDVRMPTLSRQAGAELAAKLWTPRKMWKNHGKTVSFPRIPSGN